MLKMFTVYDSKTEAYLPPFCTRSVGEALRSFEAAANDPKSNIFRYPADFTLFELGTYDDDKGDIDVLRSKRSLGCAIEFKTPDNVPDMSRVVDKLEAVKDAFRAEA